MSHTVEPWHVLEWDDNSFGIYDLYDDSIALFDEFKNFDDATRIVDCVNACKDIPSDQLQNTSILSMMNTLVTNNELLTKQNKEMLEALEQISVLSDIHEIPITRIDKAVYIARTTISKMEKL